MKVVLDTNVLFAAFAARGLCEELFVVCLRDHEIILSQHILAELSEHLVSKIKLSAARVREIESLLRDEVRIVEPIAMPKDACKDPDDLPVLGTAVAARADALVTGDKALLELKRIHDTPILSPREFYERLR